MGDEFRVNSYGELFQQHPDIAVLRDGSFVVVWDSAYDADDGGSGAGYYVAAQRYSAAGNRLGNEILLSELPLRASQPSITALRDGGYALAWTAAEGSILGRDDVFVRSFDANGAPRAAARRLNPAGDEFFRSPEVSALPDGGFVAFYSRNEEDAEGNFRSDGSFGRVFDADGGPRGGTFALNVPAVGDQINPQAARLSNGDTVVIFDSELSTINDAGNPVDDLRGRILTPAGTPRGREFVLSEDNDGVADTIGLTETSIAVAALSGGRFVATWYETVLPDRGDATYQIRGRIFDSRGSADGGEFLVNTSRDSVPEHSAVAALEGGGFVVIWDIPSELTDTPYSDVYGQLFDEAGRRLGGEFVVSQTIEGDQEFPTVAALPGGGFVAAWQSEFVDSEYEGIAARVFDLAALPGLLRQGGRRDDRIEGSQLADDLSGGAGDDALIGGAGNDLLRGEDGDDRIAGDDGDDRLSGGADDDFLYGGRGDDVFYGGAGEDRVFGGYGGDRLAGGGDADVLTGGFGADVFIFEGGDSTLAARDRVLDFERRKDVIDLSDIDADADRSGNQRFDFIGRETFDGTAGQLRLSSVGVLLGDVDGDRRAEVAVAFGEDARLGTGDFIL